MILRKLTLALSAVALSFSVTTFAQQAAPQPEQQTPTNPAGEVIGKLATMGHMQFGDFPVTQTELDRASEFVQARAAQTGKTITRDQSLVALGYIAGQLGVFMQLQGNGQQQAPDDDLGPTPQAVPAPQPAPQAAPAAPQPAPQANNQLPPGAVQAQPIEIIPNGMMMGNGQMMGNAPMMIYAPEVGATGQAPAAAPAQAQAPAQAPAQATAPQSAQQ
ncbi:serine/threonine protein kinase [Parasutterella excrementihominis]|uniref:serine/threonine protein kinase n=1 Tax=Parasutterella excrementihominis TaxID=487175 RepID=UPI003A92F0EB